MPRRPRPRPRYWNYNGYSVPCRVVGHTPVGNIRLELLQPLPPYGCGPQNTVIAAKSQITDKPENPSPNT